MRESCCSSVFLWLQACFASWIQTMIGFTQQQLSIAKEAMANTRSKNTARHKNCFQSSAQALLMSKNTATTWDLILLAATCFANLCGFLVAPFSQLVLQIPAPGWRSDWRLSPKWVAAAVSRCRSNLLSGFTTSLKKLAFCNEVSNLRVFDVLMFFGFLPTKFIKFLWLCMSVSCDRSCASCYLMWLMSSHLHILCISLLTI